MEPYPSSPTDVEFCEARRHELVAELRFSRELIHDLRVDFAQVAANEFRAQVRMAIYGELPGEEQFLCESPATWWDHLIFDLAARGVRWRRVIYWLIRKRWLARPRLAQGWIQTAQFYRDIPPGPRGMDPIRWMKVKPIDPRIAAIPVRAAEEGNAFTPVAGKPVRAPFQDLWEHDLDHDRRDAGDDQIGLDEEEGPGRGH